MGSPAATASPAVAELPRKLNLLDTALLLVGAVIGSGIFVVPSLIARRIAEPGLVIAIWVFSGLLVLCGALTFAELGAMLPRSGGLYVYIREAYGPFWGFLYGWTNFLVVISAPIAALTAAFLLYLEYFFPLALWLEKLTGIAIILLLAGVNCLGVQWGARVQNLFTFLKVAGLVGLVGAALLLRNGHSAHFLPLWPQHFSGSLGPAIGVAMISTLFAYDGWHFVGFAAGEIRNPERNVPYGILLGVLIVIAVYVSANVAYIYVLGQPGIAASSRVAADAMTAMIGPLGATLITLAILCSTFGAINANVLAGPRIFFAMARDRVFPRWLAQIHPRYETPAHAIWAVSLWAAVLTLTGGYEHLITMAMFAAWILFAMAVASVIVLRRKHPEWPRPYRLLGYPWTAMVFVLVAVAFVINTLVESPRSSLLGLGLVLAGVPMYLRWRPSR
ncbi:MAG TPA: amino acid permease [Bryobacterales bacterium]|nr:amino acid permease [Bryobacterales bacterium]